MAKHTVIAPLVLAKNEHGAVEYFYRGAVLPSYVKGDALKALVADGLVGSEDDLTAQPDEAPTDAAPAEEPAAPKKATAPKP